MVHVNFLFVYEYVTSMNLSEIDLNLLLVLHAVLEERSVARAAKKLHVTPPAISNALGRLREVLGDPLLVRRGRGVVPTPRAVEIRPRLAAALAEIQRAIGEDATFEPSTTRRRFVLACADGDQICSVPQVASAAARELPLAQLHVVGIDRLVATDGLASGDVDVAFAPTDSVQEGLHSQELYEDEAVLVLRRGHPIRSGRLSRAQFNSLSHIDVWLVGGRAGEGNRAAREFLEHHGLERRVAAIAPGFAAAAAVAAATDWAAGMPRRVASVLAQGMPLRLVDIPAPPMRMRVSLVWHARTHQDAGAAYFRNLVVDAVRGPVRHRRATERRHRGR